MHDIALLQTVAYVKKFHFYARNILGIDPVGRCWFNALLISETIFPAN